MVKTHKPVKRSGEWWDLYFKVKAEYDLMRFRGGEKNDPCIPAERWDGTPIGDRPNSPRAK